MKETTIEPYLPMLERFEEFFREELASRLSVESVDSVMEAAVENFHRISAIIPDVPPTSPWVKNIIGIAYEIGLWARTVGQRMESGRTFHCYAESIEKAHVVEYPF